MARPERAGVAAQAVAAGCGGVEAAVVVARRAARPASAGGGGGSGIARSCGCTNVTVTSSRSAIAGPIQAIGPPPPKVGRGAGGREVDSGVGGCELKSSRSGDRLELGRAAQDEPLAGAGHGHVEQPALLIGLGRLPLLAERPVIECGLAPAAAGLGQPQPEPAVAADPHQLGAPARPAAEVGDAHHVELEPLGAVDRHQPHRVERLALDRRLRLARLAAAGATPGGAAGPCPPRD